MEPNLCVLMDFENIAAGAEKEGHGRFDTKAVMTRLKEKGRILIARSYGDWGRFAKYKQAMLEQSIQAIELTSYRGQEKNRADIALAVDAMELAFEREYLDTFVLLSGDSDFTPLVMRLRELNRRVIGIGTRRSSSRLLVESCDEFIFYESIIRGRRASVQERTARRAARPEAVSDSVESLDKEEAMTVMVETIEGLQRDEPGPVLAGRVKQSLQRKNPTFDESDYGYAGFARFLEAARDRGLVALSQDERAGGYRVDLPGEAPPPPVEEPDLEDEPQLAGEPARLRDVLIAAGVDPLDAMMRHVVVHEFVDHVTDRTRKKKRNTLIYTVGDVARRCRQTDPPVRTQQVKSVLQAVLQAGELIHADGRPIRRESAPFTVRKDGEEILRELRAFYVGLLLDAGEPLDDGRALSLLLWGDEDHVMPSEELVAWASHERSVRAAAAESSTAEANGPEANSPEATAAEAGSEEGPSDAEPDAEGSEEDAAEAAPGEGEATSSRRRRRRRRKSRDGAEAAEGLPPDADADAAAATADATAAEEPAEEPTEEPTEEATEEQADEAEAAPQRKRRTTRKKKADAPAEAAPADGEAGAKKRTTRRRTTRKKAATEPSTED